MATKCIISAFYPHLYTFICSYNIPIRKIYFEYERKNKNQSSKKSNGYKPHENGGAREQYQENRTYGEDFYYFCRHLTLFDSFEYAILTRVGMTDGL